MPFQLPDLPYAEGRAGAASCRPRRSITTTASITRPMSTRPTTLLDETRGSRSVAGRGRPQRAKRDGNIKLFNNAAQLWNHSFFWQCLAPAEGQQPDGQAQGS